MGKRSTPPLTPSEVVAVLVALGFTFKRQEGSHAQYECPASAEHPRSLVTVDMARGDFDEQLMRSMIRQSNRSRERFYGATKRTARKASVPFVRLTENSADPEAE
jgi:predicted RNA binding protein YcfA (HicA-like mRNA interferase family)